MGEEILAEKLEQLATELNQLRAEVGRLKAPKESQPQPVVSSNTNPNRRTLLKKLAGGLVMGTAVIGGVLGGSTSSVEAKIATRLGRVGGVITPDGDTALGNLPTGSIYKYGLVVLSGTGNFDLSNSNNLIQANAAVFARSDNTGVYSYGDSSGLKGVSSSGVGVSGSSSSNNGILGSSTTGNGIFGSSAGGDGVRGLSTGGNGVSGSSTSGNGVNGTSGTGYGVYGTSATNEAGYFEGDVQVTGMFSKGGGAFKIDHPLDPTNQYLYHSFVESPDMLNIYNGVVTLDEQGEALVELPDWFEILNSDYRYQLTSLGTASPNLHIAGKIKNLHFKIGGGLAGQEVSWQVTGIRQDEWAKAHRIPVEETKSEKERGYFLHPLID